MVCATHHLASTRILYINRLRQPPTAQMLNSLMRGDACMLADTSFCNRVSPMKCSTAPPYGEHLLRSTIQAFPLASAIADQRDKILRSPPTAAGLSPVGTPDRSSTNRWPARNAPTGYQRFLPRSALYRTTCRDIGVDLVHLGSLPRVVSSSSW
jgi:hypothetical protein